MASLSLNQYEPPHEDEPDEQADDQAGCAARSGADDHAQPAESGEEHGGLDVVRSWRLPSSTAGSRQTFDRCVPGRRHRAGSSGSEGRPGAPTDHRSVVVAGVDVDARDALAVEHVRRCADRPRTPAGGRSRTVASSPTRPLLEDPGRHVVAELAHDQQVPAQLVALEPRQGLGLHPDRSGRQQHDPVVGRRSPRAVGPTSSMSVVVAAGLEERLPIGERVLDVVLAAGGVGQHPVHVEHDRRPARRSGPRATTSCRSARSAPWKPPAGNATGRGRGGAIRRRDALDSADEGHHEAPGASTTVPPTARNQRCRPLPIALPRPLPSATRRHVHEERRSTAMPSDPSATAGPRCHSPAPATRIAATVSGFGHRHRVEARRRAGGRCAS